LNARALHVNIRSWQVRGRKPSRRRVTMYAPGSSPRPEELFERSGLESVSLREVTIAAGRDERQRHQLLLRRPGRPRAGVLEKHHAAVEARRHALLDEYEDAGRDDLRALSAALVKPFAAELEVPGGAGYMQVEADVINRPLPILGEETLSNPKESVTRWRGARRGSHRRRGGQSCIAVSSRSSSR